MKITVAAVMVLISWNSAVFCQEECREISLHYHERAPYSYATLNGVSGLTATPAENAFRKAGIQFKWVLSPAKRQFVAIENNTECDCAIGWFKNAEREKIVFYTEPIYQDKAIIAIARAANDLVKSNRTVESVLSNPKLILGTKIGYSYGLFLDSKIAQIKPVIDTTTGENIVILKKIYGKRNDYFFIAQEEADSLIKTSGLPKSSFKYVTFSNMPEGEKRFIICSKKVGSAIIEKINMAILEQNKK
ncbi:MAG: transporter substrate-binding domain-containing protein [Desulfobacteraceae bacterium]|jgi:hypothetical protein